MIATNWLKGEDYDIYSVKGGSHEHICEANCPRGIASVERIQISLNYLSGSRQKCRHNLVQKLARKHTHIVSISQSL